MELREVPDPESRMQQAARVYGEVVTRGIVLLFWTVVAVLAILAGFLAVRIGWAFVQIVLQAV